MVRMEIHVPGGPITGWSETVNHLSIITAGVLIALALEGASRASTIGCWCERRSPT
jgi:hypothetical protein